MNRVLINYRKAVQVAKWSSVLLDLRNQLTNMADTRRGKGGKIEHKEDRLS